MDYVGSSGLKVKLIAYSKLSDFIESTNKDPDLIIAESGSISHSKDFKNVDDQKTRHLIDLLKSLGHESVFEHVSFTFRIEGISRVCSHQLVRHRMASFTQQSQRYVPLNPEFIIPESLIGSEFSDEVKNILENARSLYKKMVEKGIRKEDARFILPQAVETKIIVTMNGRELRHFISLRAEKDAQWEIRKLAIEMLKEAYKVAPILLEDLYKKYVES
ncbi:MAG: FAD-dependent thymidylate synthase [Thermoplasmata archaeon]|nr:FAD-dependent thymidylate synthase [Thermoplasmata archaeon]